MAQKVPTNAGENRLNETLSGVDNCPYCGVANPTLQRTWHTSQMNARATPGPQNMWAAYRCTSCGSMVFGKGADGDGASNAKVAEVIPSPKEAHVDIPEPARTFLQQAYQTLHAPDAAAMVAGSAVDAMLKELGYKEGSVYTRITKAVEDHKLTEGMGRWAHEVRLGSNRPRHADEQNPHVSAAEAAQSVEFAESLGFFLFVLTRRVERGTKAAQSASSA
jgi:hypothetical protein